MIAWLRCRVGGCLTACSHEGCLTHDVHKGREYLGAQEALRC
jgi:hypothetical protein